MCLLCCLPKMQDHMLSVVGWSCSPPTTYIAVLTMASTRQFSSTTRLPARIWTASSEDGSSPISSLRHSILIPPEEGELKIRRLPCREHSPKKKKMGQKNSVRTRVSDPDPDWIRIQSGQWIRRAKMTHKSRKKLVKVYVLKCWIASCESWRLLL